jgi:mRNA interferase MazF
VAAYIPRKGDFISLSFAPQSGHEQKGRRPALVLSNTVFNVKTGLALVCPITNTDRGHPLHVAVGAGAPVTGFVMVEQLKSVDYRARAVKRIGVAGEEVVDDVLARLDACLY